MPNIKRNTEQSNKYPQKKRATSRKNNEYDYSDLYSSRAKYTAEEKLEGVTAYVMTGTTTAAAKLTGLSHQCISEWKCHATWWPDAYIHAKKLRQEEMDGVMTAVIHAAGTEVLDRVLNGDHVIDKNGDLIRKPMGGKEMATTLAILYDKRALLRGDPTSRSEKVDTQGTLEDIRKELTKIAHDHLDKTTVTTIDNASQTN